MKQSVFHQHIVENDQFILKKTPKNEKFFIIPCLKLLNSFLKNRKISS